MDFVVRLPKTLSEYDLIWMIMDYLTKFVHFVLVRMDYIVVKLAKLYMNRL